MCPHAGGKVFFVLLLSDNMVEGVGVLVSWPKNTTAVVSQLSSYRKAVKQLVSLYASI